MVKSRAEIQKAYRQRLKEKNNEQYLAKERARRKANYVPSGQLGQRERSKRNEKNKVYLRMHRKKRKAIVEAVQNAAENQLNQDHDEEQVTSGYESMGSVALRREQAGPSKLLVQMNFPARSRGSKVRMRNALNACKRELKSMQEKYESLKTKYKSTLRTVQRTRKKNAPILTPKSKTESQLKDLGLNKRQKRKVRRHLLFSNTLCEEISSTRKNIPKHQRHTLHNLVGGKILKKYRCIEMASKATGLSRNSLSRKSGGITTKDRFIRQREVRRSRDKVIAFMQREDNSRMMPGKKDCQKVEGLKEQRRVLTDYLSNLHRKFLSENASAKLSLASFCRIRPKNILLASFISRSTCLCTKHQNMSLTLKAARQENIQVTMNGDQMLKSKDAFLEDVRENVVNDEVRVSQWKRIPVEEKGKKKMVMKVVESCMPKKEFIEHTEKQTQEFSEHVSRVHKQYSEMKRLKEELPRNHVIVQMDFAENYSCKSLNEVQSAYWNQTSVTLHPVVIYFRQNGSNELLHKSFVIVSDELVHATNTVLTFIRAVIPEVHTVCPDATCIHYWTDSPSSQYRNKFIFTEVANHQEIHGLPAKWNYFEAGHGKGPCDGLGGITKRMADEAVNTGKASIQDAQDFFAWTQSNVCNLQNVTFIFVGKDKCEMMAAEYAGRQIKAVNGTMKIHAVAGHGHSEISVRDTSCYCETCLCVEVTCNSWKREYISCAIAVDGQRNEALPPSNEIPETMPAIAAPETETKSYEVNDFVAAKYNDQWYIGKIVDKDEEDGEVEVSFMERKKIMFQWPNRQDIIWVKYADIITNIQEPIPVGKSRRMFKLNDDDKDRIEHMFSK